MPGRLGDGWAKSAAARDCVQIQWVISRLSCRWRVQMGSMAATRTSTALTKTLGRRESNLG